MLAACAPRLAHSSATSSGETTLVPATTKARTIALPEAGNLPTDYGGDDRASPPPHDAAATAAVGALVDLMARLGRPPLVEDGRLSRAAADLAAVLPAEGPPPDALVALALERRGLVEPPPHLFLAVVPSGDEGSVAPLLQPELAGAPDLPRWSRYGVGSAASDQPGSVRVLLATQESDVDVDPLPRALPDGGTARLSGRIHPPFRAPEIFLTTPAGASQRLTTSGEGGSFSSALACDKGPGVYQVEVGAQGPTGGTVLANFPIYCGVAPPTAVAIAAYDASLDGPVEDPAKAETLLAALIERDRARAGIGTLALTPALATVARAHSCDMATHAFVGHLSPRTGSPADRVAAAGLSTDRLLENVALAYSVREVERGLMGSPGHRENLLDPAVNRLGVGVCLGRPHEGRRELYVTELFAAY